MVTFLNSFKVLPKALPISGSLDGPKTIKAIISININPGIPILLIKYITSQDYSFSSFTIFFASFTSSVTSLVKRSEEHTSELQSRGHLVCRLLLEKKKK